MPRYSQGAIVLQQDSPWTEFLNGIGQGVSMGVKNRINKAADRKKMTQEFVLAAMRNEIPPEKMASKEFIDLTQSAGIFDDPDIQGLISRARQALPKEMTEVPPTPGAEYAAVPSPQPGQGPAIGGPETLGTGQPVGSMPPAAVAMPMAQITPTAIAVHEYLLKKQEDKKLAYDDAVRRQAQAYQQGNFLYQENIRRSRRVGLAQGLEEARAIVKGQGFNPDQDADYHVDNWGLVSFTMRGIDPAKLATAKDKVAAKETLYETTASKYEYQRLRHTLRLQDLLNKDTMSLTDFAFSGDEEPEVKALLLSTAKLLSSKAPTKEKVTEIVDRIGASIDVINKSIERYNKEIDLVGRHAGIQPESVKPITFEEISGGLTPEQYKAKKNPPSADKLISKVRDDYQPSRITSNLPASSSGKESDRVKDAYTGIAEVVQTAMGSNQGLTRESIRGNIMEMKDQIMAEYVLNERSFSLLLTMADRVMG